MLQAKIITEPQVKEGNARLHAPHPRPPADNGC